MNNGQVEIFALRLESSLFKRNSWACYSDVI